jgi:tetratricopeptide (TPR) repeat protein
MRQKYILLASVAVTVIIVFTAAFYLSEVLTHAGDDSLNKGDLKSTRKYLLYAVILNPLSSTALEKRGQVEYWDGNYEEAIRWYNRAGRFKTSDEYYLWQGQIYFAQGDYSSALKSLLMLQEPVSKQAKVLNAMAATYIALGQYTEGMNKAIEAVKEASDKNDPYNVAKAYHNFALISARERKYEVAEKQLKDALLVWPGVDYPLFYYDLGRLYEEWGKTDDALHAYERFGDLAPKYRGKVDLPIPEFGDKIPGVREKINQLGGAE